MNSIFLPCSSTESLSKSWSSNTKLRTCAFLDLFIRDSSLGFQLLWNSFFMSLQQSVLARILPSSALICNFSCNKIKQFSYSVFQNIKKLHTYPLYTVCIWLLIFSQTIDLLILQGRLLNYVEQLFKTYIFFLNSCILYLGK